QLGTGEVAGGFEVGASQAFVLEDAARGLVTIERDYFVCADLEDGLAVPQREFAADTGCGRGVGETRRRQRQQDEQPKSHLIPLYRATICLSWPIGSPCLLPALSISYSLTLE